MATLGDRLTLRVERVATGGRMIARHDGAVVLVAGAIPGELVEARVERTQRHTLWATTTDVLEPSPDRVDAAAALACGGNVWAHIAAPRQLALKAQMLGDALRRIGKFDDLPPVTVDGSGADGYRTRARVHLRAGHAGFFDEGSHRLCDVAGTRQLSDDSARIVVTLAERLAGARPGIDAEIEWAENVEGTERVAHVTAAEDVTGAVAAGRVSGLHGLSWSRAGETTPPGWGLTHVADTLAVADAPAGRVLIRHQARAFFQGNRHLLQALFDDVMARVVGGVVSDLYAGVGLFALGAAARGAVVDAVEGHPVSAADLAANARAFSRVTCHATSVEAYLAGPRAAEADVAIVDPPRTGLSPEAMRGLLARMPARVVYVSCDAATLARDARRLVDGGYALGEVRGFDLFPRTGHVEAVVTFARRGRGSRPRSPRTADGTLRSARSSPGATVPPRRTSSRPVRSPR